MAIRKNMGKGRGKGFKNLIPNQDSRTHSLSAKGIKQPQSIHTLSPPPPPNDEEQTIIDRYSVETLKDIKEVIASELGIKESDVDFNDIRVDGNSIFIELDDSSEFRVFDSDDEAEQIAKEQVRDDLENEPELFTQSWLESFIDIDNLKDQLEPDLDDMNQSYYDDIANEGDSTYGTRAIQELVSNGELDEDDVLDKNGDPKDSSEIDGYDEAVENAVEKMTQDQLSDPMDYLEGIYGDEAPKEAIRIGGLDIDGATENAIATDGWQHFLSRYDGDSTDLKNGQVLIREN